ncbi:hypothetical protein T261_8549 [Streptomyces lydicus]|nr:hypothetical protein T261_8549 [Streptomyces lydicus]
MPATISSRMNSARAAKTWKISLPAGVVVARFGNFVVVSLRVRRFVCAEKSCLHKTCAEQVPGFTRRSGRRTERLRSTLLSVGLALAGRAGSRMTDIFGAPVSPNALLRLIVSLPDPDQSR